MKKVLLITGLIIASMLFSSTAAFAHFPKTDGDMTVTLHVDPNDDPTPDQQANLYFLFDYSGRVFDLSTCNCVVTISEQGKQLFSQILLQKKYDKPSIWGTNVPYIFPTTDVYQIMITGKPKTPNAFEPFKLLWNFRVDPNDDPGIVEDRPSDLPMILGFVFIGLLFLIFMGIFIKREILDAEEAEIKKRYKINICYTVAKRLLLIRKTRSDAKFIEKYKILCFSWKHSSLAYSLSLDYCKFFIESFPNRNSC